MPIAGVSEMLGIPVPTIRSWERRYGLGSPSRTDGRHRRYSIQDAERLRVMRDAIRAGHTARDAAAMAASGAGSDAASRPFVDALLAAATALDADRVRATLDEAAGRLGVDAAIGRVAVDALHEVGSRWKAGTCDVENEHLLTDMVRSWLARLRTLAPPPRAVAPVVLACGPKELHSVGLEAFATLLALRGWPTRMLGALTPPGALVEACRTTRARAAVVVAQRSVHRQSTVASLKAVNGLSGVEVFYAGAAFSSSASRRDALGTYLGDDVLAGSDLIGSRIPMPATSITGSG